jgi:hypothetical protein
MLSPPTPLPSVKSPPCSMKLGMTRWKMLPLLLRRGQEGIGREGVHRSLAEQYR